MQTYRLVLVGLLLTLPATLLIADDSVGPKKTSAADATVQTHASTLTLIDEQGKRRLSPRTILLVCLVARSKQKMARPKASLKVFRLSNS